MKAFFSTQKEQYVILNADGIVLESSDLIFSTEKYKTQTVFGDFPVLESIFPSLLHHQGELEDFILHRVELDLVNLKGFFDFAFIKLDYQEKEIAIYWHITDRTIFYSKLQKLQQIRHENFIKAPQETKAYKCLKKN